MAPILEKMVIGAIGTARAGADPVARDAAQLPAKGGTGNEQVARMQTPLFRRRGEKAAVIRRTLKGLIGQYDVNAVHRQLLLQGVRDITKIEIGRVLLRLSNRGRVKIVQHGTGSAPNFYRNPETQDPKP